MRYKDAFSVEQTVWQMRLSDWPRASNRALIDNLFNGVPPYTPEEQTQNRISTNYNDLSANRIFHDATRQFSNALLKPGNFFSVKLDFGPAHKRTEWSEIITQEINRVMKRSTKYRQVLRNVIASLVLHGIGPVAWADKQRWCPNMHSVADVLVPSRSLLTMENLPHFAIQRRYTAAELYRVTHGPKVDTGWQMDVVNRAITWAQTQFGQTVLTGTDYLKPEQFAEDIKENTGLWANDLVPTIDCWDFYFLDDSKKEWGWKRRMILDTPDIAKASDTKRITASNKNIIGERNNFIYDPGDRNYASSLNEILHFQFADGSVVAPFRYHSVRSLGWLLYAVCHLQNRLHCKLNDAAFETLLNYFRVANPDDAERLQKIDLINFGVIPDGLNFVRPEERWQVNTELASMSLTMNRQTMADSSASFSQQNFGYDQQQGRQPEKTATQINAEVNAATAAVGSMLQEAYSYQEFQHIELSRRFCIKHSKDSEVRDFRLQCLKRGVPIEALDHKRWEISAERVLGGGNKQLEIAQASMVMEKYALLDPDGQQVAKRNFFFAVTDNPALVNELVPLKKNPVNDSVHDAQLSAATLLMGLQMGFKQGVNHGEYAATLIGLMNSEIQMINRRGGVATADEIAGLQNIAGQTIDGQMIPGNGAMAHIQILSQDEEAKPVVKQLSDQVSKLMNLVKAFAQRLQEQQQQQAQQNGNGGPDAETSAKLQGSLILAQSKAKIMEANNADKLRAKEEQNRLKMEQSQQRHELEMANTIRREQVSEAALDLRTSGEILRQESNPNGE